MSFGRSIEEIPSNPAPGSIYQTRVGDSVSQGKVVFIDGYTMKPLVSRKVKFSLSEWQQLIQLGCSVEICESTSKS